ncbi:MAG: alkane 1-monooxygenase [Pseudomonadota bacterium]
MIFVSQTTDGDRVTYTDKKRYLWVLSILTPSIPGLCAVAILSGASPLWSLFSVVFNFGFIPLFDYLMGEDVSNPPEEVVEQLSQDTYYRILLLTSVPVLYFSFIASAIAVGTVDLPWWSILALAIGAGVASGAGLTVGHELGHKPNRIDQWGAKFANAVTGYAHFCIEHNKGHHTMVATPEDPASSRLNESVYAFMLREIPGAAVRGWEMEAQRLERKGYGFWTWRNDLLQGYSITAVLALVLIVSFGLIMLPFLLIHHFIGWLQLTFANYVEHYGLKRERKENGRYKPCEPHHSWNTNHIVSNLMLFHLQRHSDHHANPMRPYQSLRDFEDLPRLPSGYAGSFVLAAIPPLWFRIMNPKVMDWAGGDLALVNTGK